MSKNNIVDNKRMESICKGVANAITPKGYLKEWETEVQPLVSSTVWLRHHGLEKNGLLLQQILPPIGFKFAEKTDVTDKTTPPGFGKGNCNLMLLLDGNAFNIACNKEKLFEIEKRLMQAIYLFKRRIEWLTTESRRTFGVIEETSVTIILNFYSISAQQFNQYMTALENVLRQQVSKLSRFNLIRACEDMQLFSPESVPVSHESIENAVKWIWNLDRLVPDSKTAAVEAILRALNDKQIEAVYFYTEGLSVDSGREILKHKVTEASRLRNGIPIHVVSFNCDSSNTIKFLRDFVESTKGRFHAYAVTMDVDAYEPQAINRPANRANVILKRKTLGGVPPGSGIRKDVVLIFEEMEKARINLEQIHQLREKSIIMAVTSTPIADDEADSAGDNSIKDESYISSKEWLQSNGFEAKGLRWEDIVSNLAFRHTDTVVDLMHPPSTETQREAVVEQKLINANYCDELFPIVKFKDGRVFHVQVTTDIYRDYEQTMHKMLRKMQKRIDWLKTGSRALFGTLVEPKVYILIDTSASMENSLSFVKQKILILMQEQLRYKRKFNFIAFNSKANSWKDKIVNVSEQSLKNAWTWIQNLSCSGSTNTFAAIQMAMIDPQVEAIYLLTDGRPDQPPSLIISQLKVQKNIPIHTISFNCNDTEANNFLYNLAKTTGGRYHCFSQNGSSFDQPESWESMDIKDLKLEINNGVKNLKELLRLRDECLRLMWKKGTDEIKKSRKSHSETEKCSSISDNKKNTESTTNINRKSNNQIKRPSTAPSKLSINASLDKTPIQNSVNLKKQGYWPTSQTDQSASYQKTQRAVTSSSFSTGSNRNRYFHTRTDSGRFSANEWMLPESKMLFKKHVTKMREIAGQEKRDELAQNDQQNRLSFKSRSKTEIMKKREPMSSKQWLSKHGLEAKHLSIMDALECTFIAHSAKYVPSLDKYITGKVFNQIMPMAFVSGDSKMYFFNPGGVNLKEYENKVRAAVDKIREHLNIIVWNALPVAAKKEFDFDGPLSFEKNQEKLLQFLKEANWPIPEVDITDLMDEIANGEKFISQSKALRQASPKGNRVDQEFKIKVAAESSSQRSRSADSSVTLELNSLKMEEYSPRRTRSASELRHSDQSEAADAKNQRKSQTPSRSRSQSSIGKKSPSNNKVKSNHQKLSSASDSRSSSTDSNKSFENIQAQKQSKKKYKLPDDDEKHRQTVQVHITKDGLIMPKVSNKNPSISKISYPRPSINLRTNRDNFALYNVSSSAKNYPEKRQYNLKKTSTSLNQQNRTHAQLGNINKGQSSVKYRSKIDTGRFQIKLKNLSGQKVIAKRDEDGLYYPAVVVRCPDPEHSIVNFECDNKEVHTRCVFPYGGAISCPPLYVGDCVLIKVICLDSLVECFVPAIIKDVPMSHSDDKFYTVIMYNGQRALTKRRHLVKINRNQFESDCAYIAIHQNVNNDVDEPLSSDRQRSRHRNRKERPDDRKKHARQQSFPDTNDRNRSSRSQESSSESSSRGKSPLQEITGRKRSTSASNSESSHSSMSSNQKNSTRNIRSDSSSESDEHQKDKTQAVSSEKKAKKEKNKKLGKHTNESTTGSDRDVSHSPWWLHELRMTLQKEAPLSKGEHVLARWSDDGWYYKGLIMHYYGNNSYEVQDNSGFTEQIWREDIIQKIKKHKRTIKTNDPVIALHSKYNMSYAPGIVVGIEDKIQVKFYDNHICAVEQQEVYNITYSKYKLDVVYIKKKEDQLVQSAVVARCEKACSYYPGTIVAKLEGGKEYDIQWANGTRSSQQVIHIFGAFSRRPKIHLHSRVLACSDPVLLQFLPGTITKCLENSFSVKFFDGTRQDKVLPDQCFWISESYYHEAMQYCGKHRS